MSADSELLIKIKTILESQGIDGAKKEIDNLIDATKKNASASKDLSDAQRSVSADMQSAARTAFALRSAAHGSAEGFQGLIRASFAAGESLGVLVTRFTLVGSAFAAGWKIGDVIRQKFIDPLITARDETDKFGSSASAAANKLKNLNTVELTGILKGLDAIAQSADAVQARLNTAVQHKEALFRSEQEVKKAEIEASDLPISDEVEVERSRTEKKRLARYQMERSSTAIGAAESAKSGASYLVASAENTLKDARENQAKSLEMVKLGGGKEWIDATRSYREQAEAAEKALSDAKIKARDIIEKQNAIIEKETVARYVAHNEMVTADITADSQIKSIRQKISDDFDKAAAEVRPSNLKARDLGQQIIDSLGLNPLTVVGNTGLPLSEKGQAQFDANRLSKATKSVKHAVESAYDGADSNAVMDELIATLKILHARLSGTISSEQTLRSVMRDIRNLQTQKSVSAGGVD